MPDVLWPIFGEPSPVERPACTWRCRNTTVGERRLLDAPDDPGGATQLLGRHLNFNPHLHILVSSGGLHTLDDSWISDLRFDVSALIKRWRFALVTYLRQALRYGLIASDRTPQALRATLTAQYERWWNVDVQRCGSKEHSLRYAGRYVRRPPLAQYRILGHTSEEVRFRTQDHRLKKEVVTRYTAGAFIDALADHVQDHYKHAIRHFGLLSPRSRNRDFGALFTKLGQVRRPKPLRLSWSRSIEREFGKDPQRDFRGERMQLIARRPPSTATARGLAAERNLDSP